MRSGEKADNRLIGPGSNDYGREKIVREELQEKAKKFAPVKELTPELADKIWKSFERTAYNNKVSKERVLHILKQLKASIGRMKNKASKNYRINDLDAWFGGIHECNKLIDKEIEKANK
jgi:hypothetical protein